MMSTWITPLPSKENPATSLRAKGPVKISNCGAIPKKQVFGDLKNTIQNFKAGGEEYPCGVVKNAKPSYLVLNSVEKLKDYEWPEPESLPENLTVADDYEDCFLPGSKFSKLELEELSDMFGKMNKPLATCVEPDSPIMLPQGRIQLDWNIKLDYSDEEFNEIQPVWDDDF